MPKIRFYFTLLFLESYFTCKIVETSHRVEYLLLCGGTGWLIDFGGFIFYFFLDVFVVLLSFCRFRDHFLRFN